MSIARCKKDNLPCFFFTSWLSLLRFLLSPLFYMFVSVVILPFSLSISLSFILLSYYSQSPSERTYAHMYTHNYHQCSRTEICKTAGSIVMISAFENRFLRLMYRCRTCIELTIPLCNIHSTLHPLNVGGWDWFIYLFSKLHICRETYIWSKYNSSLRGNKTE